MRIRDSRLGRALGRALAVWSIFFGIVFGWIGQRITSKQWQLLMGVPGQKWFWAVLFTVAGGIALLGLTMAAYRMVAGGMFAIGCGCLLISAFYLLAPLIDPGLLTLGYIPWVLCASVAFFAAVVFGTPVTWF